MKRRTLLRSLGLGLSAGMVMPSLLSSCKKDDPAPEVPFDGTVAIIGAGAAGMFAADILRAKGIKVFVLEAGKQIGGRIRSLRNQTDFQDLYGQDTAMEFGADFPIELGAEVYYGSDSIWGKAVQNFNIPTLELSTVGVDRYILENTVKTAADWGSDADFNSVQNFVTNLPNYTGPAQSVQEAAGVNARAQALLNAEAANFYGSNSDKIGVKLLSGDLHLRPHDNKSFFLKANPMQDFFLSRFSQSGSLVQLEKAITSINYSGDIIILKDKSGNEYQANKVIVTVPLAVLKKGGISFTPALPQENISAMQKFGMDPSFRAVIDFKKNFWGEDTGYIWGGTVAPQSLSTGVGRSELNRTLSITVNGSSAASLSSMSRIEQLNAILSEMDAVYAGQASLFVRKDLNTDSVIAAIKDWTKEEFIQGGYSYPFVNASDADRESLSKPINNKVFFAGEATDVSGDAGTINGALASAERAARELIDSIVQVS